MIDNMDMGIKTLPILGGIMCLAGCLNHPDMRVPSAVTIEDLNADPTHHTEFQNLEDGIHPLEATPSRGRFPCGIAVVRLTREWDPHSEMEKLAIQPFRGYEEPYWAELFDGTTEVRSVFPLHKKSVRDDYVTLPELFHAADVANAGTLLIYGYNNSASKDICQVFGVLYEIPGGKTLAAIKHTATISDARLASVQLLEHALPETDADWAFYVDHVAFRGFERKVKTCVWNLIDKDELREQLKPNPFENPRPAYPRTWRYRED